MARRGTSLAEHVDNVHWHVSRRKEDDWTICTENGYCVMVQPRYADRAEWAEVAERIVAMHNADLEAKRAQRVTKVMAVLKPASRRA